MCIPFPRRPYLGSVRGSTRVLLCRPRLPAISLSLLFFKAPASSTLGACLTAFCVSRPPCLYVSPCPRMQYMNSQGYCHLDMSLENTLVDCDLLNVSIIDFGMSLKIPKDNEGRRQVAVLRVCHQAVLSKMAQTARPPLLHRVRAKGTSFSYVKHKPFVSLKAILRMCLCAIGGFRAFPVERASRCPRSWRCVLQRGCVYSRRLAPFRLVYCRMMSAPDCRRPKQSNCPPEMFKNEVSDPVFGK